MPTFRVINKTTSQEVYRYAADAAIEWVGMEFATHDHVLMPEDAPTPADTRKYQGRRILSKLEFLELFNQTERITIRQARNVSPALDDYLYLLELAHEVNLDSADTQTGVNMLEQAGIIEAGRAGEILNG